MIQGRLQWYGRSRSFRRRSSRVPALATWPGLPRTSSRCEKHPPFCAVFKNKRSIYQDRLGTTCLLGKVENRGVFLQGFKVQMATNFGPNLLTDTGGGKRTRLFAPLYTKNAIVLPRQARDKYTCRESTPKERRVFSYRRD